MTANRRSAKPDWQFDGTTISVRIPMTLVRRGGRKMILAPDGGDVWGAIPAAPGREADPRARPCASMEAAA
jgi:hypothetical protein